MRRSFYLFSHYEHVVHTSGKIMKGMQSFQKCITSTTCPVNGRGRDCTHRRKLGRATQWNFHKTMFTKYLMYLVSQLSHNLWITSTAVFRCGLWGHFNWLLLIMPCIWYCFWDHRICYWYSKWDSFHSKLLWPNHVTYFIVIANSLLT